MINFIGFVFVVAIMWVSSGAIAAGGIVNVFFGIVAILSSVWLAFLHFMAAMTVKEEKENAKTNDEVAK